MDTNGSQPEVLQSLSNQDLVDYWAMDIKAPPNLYRLISRSTVPVGDVLRSMDILRQSGREYEFRTTFFERLFDWRDISRIQELLKPGDRFYLQECRYVDTLENLSSHAASVRKHLQDSPACKSLLRWGDRHQVNIQIRSL